MKIKSRCIILLLVVVILLVVTGILFALEPVAVKQPITMKGVFFSKTAQSVPLTAPLELKNVPPRPAPLTPQMLNQAINQIRGAGGLLPLIPREPTQPVVPPRVILTPWAPQSGQNYYKIIYGHNDPYNGYTEIFKSYYGGRGIWFQFETIPGKLYVIDLTIRSFSQPITIAGVYNGSASPVNDHIIIGFTATEPTSKLNVRPYGSNNEYLYFWRCELTQVN